MQKALAGLNPEGGPDFVSVYIDNIVIFCETLEDHLQHLKMVIERLQQCGLKLKPDFCREEVEYLGHIITRHGLKTNPALVAAVREFPCTRSLSISGVRFIPLFSKVAEALHVLIRKMSSSTGLKTARKLLKLSSGSWFSWLIHRLPRTLCWKQMPVLRAWVRCHRMDISTQLLLLAEHFHRMSAITASRSWPLHFLYNLCVTVYTDHSAVKAVLETPNPTAKHARWWVKVYGQGVRELKINNRPGMMNKNADALSRSPLKLAPLAIAEDDGKVQISVSSEQTIESLLEAENMVSVPATLGEEKETDRIERDH